jgi:ribosomal protein S18 acetylase RimI-like enzyme
MTVEFQALDQFGLKRAAEVLTRAFADYFVKIPFAASTLLQMARSDSVDLGASRIVLRDGSAVGAALIARRGWTSRLAAMALVPDARKSGLGTAFVERLLHDAHDRGERAMVLEVIEQNTPAVRLYEKCGFKKRRRLLGFIAGADEGPDAPDNHAQITEIDPREMAKALASAAPDWPWQLAAETLAHVAPPAQAFRIEGVSVAVTGLAGVEVTVRGIGPVAGADDLLRCASALRALRCRHPGKRWQMKPVWPEECSAAFVGAGFTRTELSQWQMQRAVG